MSLLLNIDKLQDGLKLNLAAIFNEIVRLVECKHKVRNFIRNVTCEAFFNTGGKLAPIVGIGKSFVEKFFLAQSLTDFERGGGTVAFIHVHENCAVVIFVFVETCASHFKERGFAELPPAVNDINVVKVQNTAYFLFASDKNFGRNRDIRIENIRLTVRKRHGQRHQHLIYLHFVIVFNQIHEQNSVQDGENLCNTRFSLDFAGETATNGQFKRVIQKNQRIFGISKLFKARNKSFGIVISEKTRHAEAVNFSI